MVWGNSRQDEFLGIIGLDQRLGGGGGKGAMGGGGGREEEVEEEVDVSMKSRIRNDDDGQVLLRWPVLHYGPQTASRFERLMPEHP